MNAAIVLGGANCVWDDINRAFALYPFKMVIAVNDIGADFGAVNHWCTMHPEKIDVWLQRRRDQRLPDPEEFWTSGDRLKRCPFPFKHVRNTYGGSGMLGVAVARQLGYKKIVLAGIPMHMDFEHYHTPGKWKECKLYKIVWEKDASLKADVRSMSGWTQEHLGEFTLEWLAERKTASQSRAQVSG